MSLFDFFFILVDECNEVIDYAIARSIFDPHSGSEERVEHTFELQEIQQRSTKKPQNTW